MKINFLLSHLKFSGGALADITFAHKLAERGHDVTVAIEIRSQIKHLVRHPIEHVNNLLSRHPLLPKDSKARILMVEDFNELPEADIFFGDSWKVAGKLYGLDKKGMKFEYIQHDERMYHGDWNEVDRVFRLPLRKIVNATWLQGLFEKEFHYNAPILFNAIDCNLFHPGDKARADDDIRIMLLHHNFAWKGTKEGVEVVQALKAKYPNIKLILFGTRAEKIDYPYDEYHFKAFNEKLAELFRSIDIYLCPSWDEGLCFPPRWAMASGCALVTYDNGSSRDYAFDGKTALVAKRKDVRDLSKKLEEVIVDPELRKTIAKNGLDYVRKMPPWEQLTDKLENILKDSLKNA